MKLEKGIFTDCVEQEQPPGTYRFAKNIVDSNLLGVKENEDGFTNLNVFTPYTFIGAIPIDNDSVVVFSTNNVSSEIGLVNLSASTYVALYNSDELNMNMASPVKGEYRKDVNGERVVVWVDGRNTPRILNIDNPAGVSDVQDLNIFQDINNPSVSSSTVNDFGGALPTGAYILLTRYRNEDGSETNWFVHDHVFYINDDAKSRPFNDNDGASPGTISNKSIAITLSGSDTRYDTIDIGYIRVVNNIVTSYQAFSRDNASTLNITISGSESITDVSLDEVLTPTTNYITAKAITQLSGRLYLANLTAETIPELQNAALNIRINYTHSLTDVLSNINSHKDNVPPSFMPGEVYAFYLGVELNKGGWAYYHIPGRSQSLTGSPDRQTVIDADLGLTYMRFQIQDTADKLFADSNMGYWENTDELYPNDPVYNGGGTYDLRNQPVRHHRFPSTRHLVNTYYTGDSTVGITKLIRLGISVSGVNIPTEIQSKIKRWKIFYAKKTASNSLVIGSDLHQFGGEPDYDTGIDWGTGGNWDIEAESGSPGEWRNFSMVNRNTQRGHSLDMLFDSGSATPTYALFNYRLERANLNIQYSGFRSAGARLTIAGEDRGQVASAVIDYTVPDQTVRSGAGFRKRLDNFTYLPQNAISGKFKTQYNEAAFVADIYNVGSSFDSLNIMRLYTRSSGEPAESHQFTWAPGESGTLAENTFYMQYYRFLTNVHVSFTQQDLIPLEGYMSPSTTTGAFFGGDTFMCYLSYMTAAPTNANPDTTLGNPYGEGVRMWKAYIGYSRYNFNYRYQTQGDLGTYYHGKTDVRTLFTPTVTDSSSHHYATLIRTDQSINTINYDPSMNALNEYTVGVIFSLDLVQATEFPNTIIWSPVQSEESKEFSWRSFPSGNRYTITKNKGDIINIQGIKNKELIIHTTFAFFRTRTDAQVQAEAENIFFKSANLFDLPPEELVPTSSGYGGTQNKFACVLTKAGYVYPDDIQGKMFLYNGESLEEISSNGNRVFFRDFMKIHSDNEDNPFTTNGYTIGHDERVNRIIITKKHGSRSWTISYNPIKKTWTSYHDYIPDYMFNGLGGALYLVKAGSFFDNFGSTKGRYFDSTVYSSVIDQPFNPDDKDKEFTSLNWISETYPNTYVDGQPDQTLDFMTTCTHITLRGIDHCTGRIRLDSLKHLDQSDSANVRNLGRTWSFNDIRDIKEQPGFLLGFYQNFDINTTKLNTSMEWYDSRRFIDKYLICRFEFDNTENKRFLFIDSEVEFKYVTR